MPAALVELLGREAAQGAKAKDDVEDAAHEEVDAVEPDREREHGGELVEQRREPGEQPGEAWGAMVTMRTTSPSIDPSAGTSPRPTLSEVAKAVLTGPRAP